MNRLMRVCGAAAVLALMSSGAMAQEPHHGAPGRAEHFDARYGHNHYYSNRGMTVRTVPGRPYGVFRGGVHYYYSGGAWYAPRGGVFVVVGAPVGAFVPILPPYYTTVWVAGAPYYYSDDTYYAWRADQNGYEVVDPMGEPGVASTEAPPNDDLFIYPQNGQTQEQQASDKYECHKWSNSQTGYDPTQPGGGVPPDQGAGKRADYMRAMHACLEGRGYSVR